MPDAPSDFRSDTVTKPTDAMRDAMAAAEVGDDVFGDDPTLNALEARFAEVVGKAAALFCPSGTMANQIALRVHTRPGDEAIVEYGSHVYNYEGGGGAALAGVQFRPQHATGGRLDPAAVAAAVHPVDDHLARTRLLCLENTHTHEGGTVVELERMRELRAVADQHGLRVHLDGARLWNASAASGVTPAEFAACADTVMCCLSKGLGAPVGSLLAGDAEVITLARRYRKMMGGAMRQVGVVAAAGRLALDTMRERLPEDHARARRLAEGLGEVEGLTVDLAQVQTNIVHVATAPGRALDWVAAFGAEGVAIIEMDDSTIRFVTHLDVGDGDVERAIGAASQAAVNLGGAPGRTA
ncbi:MAG: threonine aldolase family protein [Planctomycetota bacterium]|jgi:threonine aldolase